MTISFGDNNYTGKIRIDEAEMNEGKLLERMVQFNNKTRPKKEITKKWNTFDSVSTLYKGRELTLNAFKNRIFQIKSTNS